MQTIEEEAIRIRSSLFETSPSTHYITQDTSPCLAPGCTTIAHTYSCFCDRHAPAVYDCIVRDSTIPGAGKGLFAHRRLDKGITIDLYCGTCTRDDQHLASDARDYVLRTKDQDPDSWYFIDAKPTQSCVSRYINNQPTNKTNCEFRNLAPSQANGLTHTHVVVVTKKTIPKGKELFIDYGPYYGWTLPTDDTPTPEASPRNTPPARP